MKDQAEFFLKQKEIILNNLDTLEFILEKCVDEGLKDDNSALYNQIDDLMEEVKILDSSEELEELINQAKTIEAKIDSWLSIQGQTTMNLSWS